MESVARKALATVSSLPATISLIAISIYQKTLSPDHGPLRHLYPYGFCRHEPTCSEYAKNVLRIKRYPLAIALIIRRIISCNPWTKPSDEKLQSTIAKHLS